MDELIKQVAKKAGISEDQAKKAVDAVLGFLKSKLPGPVAAQVEGVLKGGAGGIVGGLLGKKG